MAAITAYPLPPTVAPLQHSLDHLSQALEAYPLSDLLQPYLSALADHQPCGECEHIYRWTDFCLSRWGQQLDTQLAQHPQGGTACLCQAHARLRADRQALDAARSGLQQLHQQCEQAAAA